MQGKKINENTAKYKVRRNSRLFVPFQVMMLLLLCLFMAFLAYTTPYSIDDFRYITYPQDGFLQYIRNNIDHYLILNGRTYVHWLLELDLYGGKWIFPVVAIAVMLLTPFVFWKNVRTAADYGKDRVEDMLAPGLLSFTVLFSGLSLAMPPFMKTDGVLWQSGFFNYVLPMPILLYMLQLLLKTEQTGERTGRFRTVWIALFSFLAGTSTEQYGCVAVCISIYFVLRSLVLKNRKTRRCFLISAAAGFIGLLVILLAPSMRDRMYRENVFSETTGNMFSVFSSQADLFTLNILNMFLVTAVIGLICLLFFRRTKKEWIIAGLNAALLLSWLMYFIGDHFLAYLFVILSLTSAGIRMLIMKDLRMALQGILLCSGVVSAMMVLPSKSYGSRLLVPLYLFLALSLILSVAGRPALLRGLQGALFVISFVMLCVTFPHYMHNYRIEMKNEAYLRDLKKTHELWYDVDYDKGYTRDKIDRGSIYLNGYLKRAGFDPDRDHLYIYSREYPGILYQNKRVGWYAKDIDGVWCLPVRYLIETAGGKVSWNSKDFSLDIELNNVSFRYINEKLKWTDAEGDHQIFVKDTNTDYEVAYFPQDVCEEAFGLKTELTYDLPKGIK